MRNKKEQQELKALERVNMDMHKAVNKLKERNDKRFEEYLNEWTNIEAIEGKLWIMERMIDSLKGRMKEEKIK